MARRQRLSGALISFVVAVSIGWSISDSYRSEAGYLSLPALLLFAASTLTFNGLVFNIKVNSYWLTTGFLLFFSIVSSVFVVPLDVYESKLNEYFAFVGSALMLTLAIAWMVWTWQDVKIKALQNENKRMHTERVGIATTVGALLTQVAADHPDWELELGKTDEFMQGYIGDLVIDALQEEMAKND